MPRVLSQRERYLTLIFSLIALVSLIAIPYETYRHFTKEAPAPGGTLTEGIVGNPRYVNPLLAQDADKDLVGLIYSGLTKYDKNGKLIPSLAESYSISSDNLSYTFKLKKNVKWHDGEPVTAGDVIFTISTVQNPDYGSPQRVNWQGIGVNKIDDYTINFTLHNKYAQFLNNTTVGILPEHIWSKVKPANFSLSELNTKPVGSGPYEFGSLRKDTLGQIQEYNLTAFDKYFDRKAYITNIQLKFYSSENEMIGAYNRGEIDSLSFVSAQKLKSVRFQPKLNLNKIALPRYFAVFLNQTKNKVLADQNVRIALNQATDKNSLINKVLDGNGNAIDSPMLPGILDIPANTKKYAFDLDQAKKTLASAGWKYSQQDKILEKEIKQAPVKKGKTSTPAPSTFTKLEIELTTSDWPELVNTANELKSQWEQLGIKVTVKTLSVADLQQAIKERNYDALLFGEVLNVDPDPFSFWHSSQKRDPGLNLALFDNKAADKLLEDARQLPNFSDRRLKYAEFQNIVIDQAAAVFLYSSEYIYPQLKKIVNSNIRLIAYPAARFDNITNWYINTKRVFK